MCIDEKLEERSEDKIPEEKMEKVTGGFGLSDTPLQQGNTLSSSNPEANNELGRGSNTDTKWIPGKLGGTYH